MKKVLVSICAAVVIFSGIAVAQAQTTVVDFQTQVSRAQTVAELQALILLINQQITQLEQQLAARQGGGGLCPTLSRSLRVGLSGSDVTSLQQYLARDVSVYPEGTISGYFGALTEAAVKRWQAKNFVISSGTADSTGYGVVGPATRAAIMRVCGSVATLPPPPTSTKRSCVIGTTVIQSGETRVFYLNNSAPFGSACQSVLRTCNDGVFDGNTSHNFLYCTQVSARSCLLPDGTQIAHGNTPTLYSQTSVPSGQNCSSVSQIRTCNDGILSGSSSYYFTTCTTSSNATTTTGRSCTLPNGTQIAHGNTPTLYSQTSVLFGQSCSAFSQIRTCNDGTLSGNTTFQHTNCTSPTTGTACTLPNGTQIAHGNTPTLYSQTSVLFGQSCSSVSQVRTCTDGTLSGSSTYQYTNCTVPTTGRTCTLPDNTQLAHGNTVTLYNQSSVLYGQTCTPFSQVRTCNDGTLSGSPQYNSMNCIVQGPGSCTIIASSTASTTIAHNTQKYFYSAETVPYTQLCDNVRQLRVCSDGYISGSNIYKYPSCSVIPARSCTLDYANIAHGSSQTFYTARSVSSSSNCSSISQSRTCTDGTLSGSATYQYSQCARTGQRWCLLDGKYVAHTATATFYSQIQVPFGNTCTQFSQGRTCTDGTLGGSSTYAYGSCTALGPASCTQDGKTLQHTDSAPFYSVRNAPAGSSCNANMQMRSCNDGYLTGSPSYQYQSCS